MRDKKQTMLLTSWISVIGNALLSVMKVIVGIFSGSLAVLSDGLDSASDVVTSLMMLFVTPFIYRPPDSKYVYGREKAENMASTILAFVIFFMGGQMFLAAMNKILHPENAEMPSAVALWVTLISIVGKLLLALYQFYQGKRIQSSMLTANAVNMRNDVIISVGVLLGLGFTFIFHLPILDPIIALLISLYIIWSAVGIFRDANLVLMDGVKDTSIYEKIIRAVEEVPGAYNPHRIRSSQIGTMYNIVLDIEAEGTLSLTEAHEIAQQVEESIKRSVKDVYDIVVHVEPKDSKHCKEKYGINKNNLTDEES